LLIPIPEKYKFMHHRFLLPIVILLGPGCGGIAYTPNPLQVNETAFELPVLANAGADREILRGFDSYLDGHATHHPQGLPFDVEWQQTAGEPVYLSNAQDPRPSFTAPLDEQELVFQITASDGRFATYDEVRLHVKHAPRLVPPRVRASADRYLDAGQRDEPQAADILEGLADDVLTSWQRLTPERIDDESSTRAAGIDKPVLYRLIGVREGLSSAPDHLILYPYDVNHTGDRAPVPSIEAETSIEPGATIQLDATATTDPNGDPVTFRWEQTGGSPVGELGTTRKLALEAPRRQEEISFRVFARDTLLESAPAKISIVVGAGGGIDLPVVVSADQRARPDRVVMLDALGETTNDEQGAGFVWDQTLGTEVDFETETQGRFLYFIAPEAPDDLAFAVFASNDTIDGPPAVARVTVVKENENLPPMIYLTPSTSEPAPGQEVSVVAKINDPEHDAIEQCEWSTEVEPDGRVVTLDPGDVCTPNAHGEVTVHFLAPPAGTTVTITLTVFDEFPSMTTAAVDVTSTY